MRITIAWLRELVPVALSLDELTTALVRAGIEVEAVEERCPVWSSVEIASIEEVALHPNADRLRLCRVRRAGTVVPVVCGASNMRPGDRVALAIPGTEMPDGRRIQRSKIRGEASEGMLCSTTELGLEADDDQGIMILPPDAPLGMPLVEYFGARDTVIELGLTPNRGDCLSVLGIAREVAAITDVPLRIGARQPVPVSGAGLSVRVAVEAEALCPRYCSRIVRGVQIGPSPGWLRTRLEMVGLRSINNVVDATNYVMIERGQPLHAFDLARIRGGKVCVRRAGPAAVPFATLDGGVRDLVAGDLVIADAIGPIALAGIMGGADSEIRRETVDLLLESAFFVPETIRRTARRLLLNTDSSYRFERGVDPEGTAAALERLTELLLATAGGSAGAVTDLRTQTCGMRKAVIVRPTRINAILGTRLAHAEIERPLRALGVVVSEVGGALEAVPPSHRFDLEEEVDFAEEVARMIGYDAIPETLPAITMRDVAVDETASFIKDVRETLRSAGLSEMVTLAMVGCDDNATFGGLPDLPGTPVRIRNPPSAESAEMRRSLLPGLLRALDGNMRHGESSFAGFTIGRVYGETEGVFEERLMLGVVIAGRWAAPAIGEPERPTGFGDLKGALQALLRTLRVSRSRWEPPTPRVGYLHPGKQAHVRVDGDPCGLVGALHPDVQSAHALEIEVWVAELDLQKLVRYFPPRVTFQPLPRFPAIQRDLAVVVDVSFQAQQIIDVICEAPEPLVEEVRVFDHYTGPPIPDGKKSLAYAISYRASERTLTDAEVNALHETLVERVVRSPGVEVRR